MKPEPTRRFGIGDALILLAATATGMAGLRLMRGYFALEWNNPWQSKTDPVFSPLLFLARQLPLLATPPLLGWSVALLLLRLRNPRPFRRRLWSQPGFLACLAACSPFVWRTAILSGSLLLHHLQDSVQGSHPHIGVVEMSVTAEQFLHIVFDERQNVPPAILLVWLMAWRSGRLRAERSWIDRSGRAVGYAWIVLAMVPMFVIGLLSDF